MVRRSIALVLLFASVGCYSVKRVNAPSSYIAEHHPEQVWVAAENGEIFRLAGPAVRGDSVVGTVNGTSEPMVLDLKGQHEVFARQKDPLKTATLIGGIGAVVGLGIYGFIQGGGGEAICPEPGRRGCAAPI
jgi:hypothetical protein